MLVSIRSNRIKYPQYLIPEITQAHMHGSQGQRQGDLDIERRTNDSPSSSGTVTPVASFAIVNLNA